MKISRELTPGATLPKDREGPITLDGEGTIMLTRNEHALSLKNISDMHIQNFKIYGTIGSNRVSKFLKFVPIIWQFCK